MGNLYTYFLSFWPHFWSIIASGMLRGLDDACQKWGVDKAVARFSLKKDGTPRWPRMNKLFARITPEIRLWFEIGFIMLAIFYSGYSAWSDEHDKYVKLLLERPTTQPTTQPVTSPLQVSYLRKLTNSELRNAVNDLTVELRASQAAFDKSLTLQENSDINEDFTTSQQRDEAFFRMNKEEDDLSAQHQFEWDTKYLPRAHALEEELQFREGIVVPSLPARGEPMGLEVLQLGNLTGPYPLAEVADYLESLARQLPP